MFPRGAPGFALLLLRLSVAATLWIDEPVACLPLSQQWMVPGLILLTIPLCVGILTPPVAVLCALLKSVSLVCNVDSQIIVGMVTISIASALALLGPGAYSVDASRFGRHLFVVTTGKEPDGP
jgi:hypothetical protein